MTNDQPTMRRGFSAHQAQALKRSPELGLIAGVSLAALLAVASLLM